MTYPYAHLRHRLIVALAALAATGAAVSFAALPNPDPDDGGLVLPPGFRALVFADNLVVGKRVGRSHENLRGLAVAPNGDVYAKGKFGQIWALRDANGDGRADQTYGIADVHRVGSEIEAHTTNV